MTKAEALADITRADFEAYERVRRSGVVNMYYPQARELAGIDRATHLGIIQHYSALLAKFGPVMTNG